MTQTLLSHARSQALFKQACACIPGGVNSPVRAWGSVGAHPVFYQRAQGSRVEDVDGNEYIDFIGSWGPMILGHRPPEVLDAVEDQLMEGLSFGAPCEAEVRLAEKICHWVPCAEQVRMVSSGTEATMSAVRLARGATSRSLILKFEGCYHGHCDALLASAGSGLATLGIAEVPGVSAGATHETLVVPFNDLKATECALAAHRGEVAAIIVEPIAGNMGVVPPDPGFLEGLRDLCDSERILLIFDEVISGFRVSQGGASKLYGVIPDLCTLGKIIGGGFPVGCFAGREEVMSKLAPQGPVYQAGTLSGNPVAMQAGLATLGLLENDQVYEQLEALGAQLEQGLNDIIAQGNLPCRVNRVGSLLTLFFTGDQVHNYKDAKRCDTDAFARYFAAMLDQGFLIAPSQFEALFLSTAHSTGDIECFLQAAKQAVSKAFIH